MFGNIVSVEGYNAYEASFWRMDEIRAPKPKHAAQADLVPYLERACEEVEQQEQHWCRACAELQIFLLARSQLNRFVLLLHPQVLSARKGLPVRTHSSSLAIWSSERRRSAMESGGSWCNGSRLKKSWS